MPTRSLTAPGCAARPTPIPTVVDATVTGLSARYDVVLDADADLTAVAAAGLRAFTGWATAHTLDVHAAAVTALRWDDGADCWHVDVAAGDLTTRAVHTAGVAA